MNTGTMTLDQIRIEGLKALERHLGPEGMIRFLQQFETGRGDYTKERGHAYFLSIFSSNSSPN